MLNRRILRIKAFKAVYALMEAPETSLREAQCQLEASCESTRDLYLFMLALVEPLTNEARARIEAARLKFNPTEEERNPNMKFVDNLIAPILAQDPDFTKIIGKKKFAWDQYDVLLRNLYETIRTREYFQEYLSSGNNSIKEDAALFARIYEEELADNEALETILEDLSIWWCDDLCYSLSWCCRTFDALGKGERWSLLPLYQSEMSTKPGVESDRKFVADLLRTAFYNLEKFTQEITALTPKWDRNRICTTDLALIVCGMAEAEAYPLMPVKVIINEYVEISKFYSTPESRAFVNGLLDRLIGKHQDNQ